MVSSVKTATGKARKGEVSVRLDSGNVKACFPRPYFPGEPHQVKKATGISKIEGWEDKAGILKRRLQLEVEEGKLTNPDGTFNENRFREILVEQRLKPNLKIVENATTSDGQLPPKPELSILEVWDMYCEYKKPSLKETVYKLDYCKRYPNLIKSAIKAVGDKDGEKIRNWLIENRSLETVKNLLSYLSKAYDRAIKSKLVDYNPFENMAQDLQQLGSKGKKHSEVEIENDKDVLDKTKAYTWKEAKDVLFYIKNNPYVCHWYFFVKFKFLTGCRTGEAIAFMWGDVLWDKKQIVFRRTYNERIKKFLPTKNETIRFFPMPENGELWNLLKSVPQGELNEIVFKSKNNRIISARTFNNTWHGGVNGTKGIIPSLIELGKLSKYLPPYNTRHTFITHQVFDLSRDEKIVNAWYEHSEKVSRRHYQDISDKALQINPDLLDDQQSLQRSEIDLLKQQLAEQQELINRLMESKGK
ncbi:site-specific integrase [Nostoc sp. DSM 114160]|jgi:integrase